MKKFVNLSTLERTIPAPISRLHDDLLWQVFSLNVLEDTVITYEIYAQSDISLIIARRTSQVCTIWRRVMLSSSLIWAKTINLKHLGQKNDKWRNEVLKRTGNALLSVIGNADEEKRTTEFFMTIWNNHWT
ncbi:hypothetical protein GALMADRAFT_256261 [Galerina marginata CBS 339.88]|uniref:F-box domain-containing protein n=1 Tax=Galerina marginata (strain CBS 339.88) TaxID=685588 RepID=A0A067SDM4_GALM3|nr:hypothetical protein GALMADRAFT_256261 [Galerina marginata CBS 339.88]